MIIDFQFIPRGSVVTRAGDDFHLTCYTGVYQYGIKSTIFCDIGGNKIQGVIDHHGIQGGDCATKQFVGNAELLTNHLSSELDKITVVTHEDPDLDAICCCYLIRKLLIDGVLPEGAPRLAEYVQAVDSGMMKIYKANPVTLATLILAINHHVHKTSTFGSRDRAILDISFGLIDTVIEKNTMGVGFDQQSMYDSFAGFQSLSFDILRDRNSYEEDVKYRSTISSLELEIKDQKKQNIVDFITTHTPKSFLWKYWTRANIDASPRREGFTATCAFYDTYKMSNRRHAIIAVDPNSQYWLKGLGILLDHFEISELLRSGKNEMDLASIIRPGYHRGNPWFDGRNSSFNYTIVDSPQGGSLLSEKKISEIIGLSKIWQDLGKEIEKYATNYSYVRDIKY